MLKLLTLKHSLHFMEEKILLNPAGELLCYFIGVAHFNYIILMGMFNNGMPLKGLRRNDAEYAEKAGIKNI
jgi:hypothetical protein